MAEMQQIAAEPRERSGKGGARAARRAGRVPGILYGNREEPRLISVEPKALIREMHRPGFFATLFNLQLDGSSERVLARDVQLDPVTDVPLHIDFMRVAADTKLHIAVPVVFQNELQSPGLKRGGVLNIVRHEIELVCSPENIPATLTVDLAGLDIGDSVHISMMTLPEGVAPAITDRDFTVATIAPPTVHAETADAAAAGAEGAAAAGGETA